MTSASLDHLGPEAGVPADLRLLGLVVLAERLRPEARATVEYLRREGVAVKVISGDAPETVAAIAADVGIPTGRPPIDGRELPDDQQALQDLVRDAAVVGRISPEGKQRIVQALRDAGLYVAMIGDGVNDVPALKAARLAIAQGSGSQMARSVADLVLVSGDFGAIPALVDEGRKLLRNLQRVAKLFVTKSVFAALLILSLGLTSVSYPFLPRHLTLASALTIGIPSFFLALASSTGPWRSPAFLHDVARFALPAGAAVALGVVASYLVALKVVEFSLIEARTMATTVLVAAGLYLILVLEAAGRRRGALVTALCLVLAALYVLALTLPSSRDFFALAAPDLAILITAGAGSMLAIASLRLTGLLSSRPPP